MEKEYHSLKKIARTAGVWYLLLMITAIYGVIYVPSRLVVKGDISATAGNILNYEFFFRTGVVGAALAPVIMMMVSLVLYRLLKIVNEHVARTMLTLITVSSIIAFFIQAFQVAALMILKGAIMKALAVEEQQNVIQLLFNLHHYSSVLLGLFWGLWLLPLAHLVYYSGFIPRIFCALLLMAGMGYIIDWFTFMLFPDYSAVVARLTMLLHPMEVPIIFWLLIKGVKNNIAVGEPILSKP